MKISSARVTCGIPDVWRRRTISRARITTRAAMQRAPINHRKMEHFTREVAYTPGNNVLVIFDRVRSTDPNYKKVWLLHGVGEPRVMAEERQEMLGTAVLAYAERHGLYL